MVANSLFNDLTGCPLSLHKFQVDPLGRFAEAVGFGHGTFELSTASSLT